MEARIREQGIGSGVSLQDPVVGLDLAPEVSRMERIPSPAAVTPGETSSAGGQRAAQASAVGDSEKTRRRRRESANQRASPACLRCRKQKLRCLGGDPCLRCVKRRIPCNFKGKDLQHADEYEVTARDRNADADPVTGELALGGFASFPGLFDDLVAYTLPHNPGALTKHLPPSTNSGSLPPPTHTRPLEPPRLGVNLYTTVSPTSTHRGASSTADKTPAGSVGFTDGSAHVGGRENDALQTGPTESLYEAPFRRLIRQSRRNSPEPPSRDEVPRFRYETRVYQEHDDPINTGIVDPALAETLFQFFVNHCHPFLPIINITQEDAFASVRGSAPLFSAVISTASRFYSKYGSRRGPSGPALDGSIPARLANLAEAHLGQTLLRRHYALSDVQAILLLAAWGLQSGGKSGPDPWVVTGHAARVSRRLGVHKALAQVAAKARTTEPGSEEWCKLESFVPQWRTWLYWFTFDGFLSLGFGRPQSTQFETVDESGFLQMRLHETVPWPGSPASLSLYGDVYIAGLVQLTQIGRDLINWIEMLVDPEKAIYADPRRAEIFRGMDLSMKNMFRELNTRIEDWSRLWVWTGSQYALHLGPSARLARLQADHLRLCLNSYALKGGADEEDEIAKYLRAALSAATSTIQTHHESSQTDLGLSFATDYLTIALAQAAVFLIQITTAPVAVQAVLGVDNAVLTHYWKMSVEILESSDMSETRLGSYLAKTIREIGRKTGVDEQTEAFDPHSLFSANYLPVADSGALNDDVFNIEDFFRGQADFDLKYLLGLPSDGESFLQDGTGGAGFSGDATSGTEAMSGMGQRWSGQGIQTLMGFAHDGSTL